MTSSFLPAVVSLRSSGRVRGGANIGCRGPQSQVIASDVEYAFGGVIGTTVNVESSQRGVRPLFGRGVGLIFGGLAFWLGP